MALTLDPADVESLFAEMTRQAAGIVGESWTEHRDVVGRYLHDLAEDGVRTGDQIAHGRMDAETARTILAMHERARHSMATFIELSALQTAQSIVEMATRLVSDAIRARTGIDILAPSEG
jgi:hypothetical protein